MIDPQAQLVLDELKANAKPMAMDTGKWLLGYREELDAIVAMQGPAPAIDIIEQTSAVAPNRRFRFYRPRRQPQSPRSEPRWPTLLFIHGGGFVAGSIEAYDIPLRWLALRSGWQIAAIDYRLAPEHPFPAALDDCLGALRHLVTRSDVDATRLAVGGDSAGGLLAAVTARHARDAGLRLALQVILYPNADLRPDAPYPSRQAFDGVVIKMNELMRSLALYCGDADRTAPDISPLLAPDLG